MNRRSFFGYLPALGALAVLARHAVAAPASSAPPFAPLGRPIGLIATRTSPHTSPVRSSLDVLHLHWLMPYGAQGCEIELTELRDDGPRRMVFKYNEPRVNLRVGINRDVASYRARVRAVDRTGAPSAYSDPVTIKTGMTIQEYIDRGWIECWKCGGVRTVGVPDVPGALLPGSQVAPCLNGCDDFWNLCVQAL